LFSACAVTLVALDTIIVLAYLLTKRLFHFGVSVIIVNFCVKSLMGLLSVGVVLCNVCTTWLLQSSRM